MRARKTIFLAVAAAALTVVGAADAGFVGHTTWRSGPLTATLYAGTHSPNCKQLWPVKVVATYNGRPARATAYYEFEYNNKVVEKINVFSATRRNPHNRLWHFTGWFYDNTFGPFGALAEGHTIYVVAVVQDGRYTARPYWRVDVVKTKGCKPITND
jgi:hypothetical protein